jgi:hypothetical protein
MSDSGASKAAINLLFRIEAVDVSQQPVERAHLCSLG